MNPACYWHENRDGVQWIRTKNLDINPKTHEHMIFDKEAKIIQNNTSWEASVKHRTQSFRQKGSLMNREKSLPTQHQTKDCCPKYIMNSGH